MGTLGCGQHTVRIIDRATGGVVAVPPLAKIQWSRRLDNWSTAVAQFTKRPGIDCCAGLANVRTWRHDLEISRDGVVVWVGPVSVIAENRSRVQVSAVDRLAWLNRRVLRGTKTLTGEPTALLGTVMHEAIGRYDRIAIRPAFTPTTATASIAWDFAARTTGWAAIRDMVASNLDLTMVADILYAGASTVPAGPVATLSEGDIVADVDVIEDGDTAGTVVHAKGASGVVATWPPEPVDAPTGDDWWGVIDATIDRNTIADPAELLAAARAAWVRRRRPPVFIDLPTGARLRPTAPVTVAQLIPGAEVTLSFTVGRCRPVAGVYVLAAVDVAQGAGSGAARNADGQFTTTGDAAAEQVSVSLIPKGRTDG